MFFLKIFKYKTDFIIFADCRCRNISLIFHIKILLGVYQILCLIFIIILIRQTVEKIEGTNLFNHYWNLVIVLIQIGIFLCR